MLRIIGRRADQLRQAGDGHVREEGQLRDRGNEEVTRSFRLAKLCEMLAKAKMLLMGAVLTLFSVPVLCAAASDATVRVALPRLDRPAPPTRASTTQGSVRVIS